MMAFRNVLPPDAIMPKAKATAARALELDPRCAEPYISLGYAAFIYDRDWPAADRYFEQGLAVNSAV
jgi:tetratricopeptide (TPR) repeat protein